VDTLNAIHDIGYLNEATWPVHKIGRRFTSGMKPVSMHLDSGMIARGGDDLNRALDQLKQYGFAYAVFPYVAPADRGGPDVIEALAEKLNRAGEKCRALGLSCCYHNHAFEFEPVNGATLLQVLADNTDKKLVGFEVDAFWVSVAGHDPAEFIGMMSGRVPLVHLKDKAEGTRLFIERPCRDRVPREADTAN
jgi:sugar phosphate isomerase/epimerase